MLVIEAMSCEDGSQEARETMLRALIKMQIVNEKYRKELRTTYEIISDQFKDKLLDNRIYGILIDGINWNFVCYEHYGSEVKVKLIHFEKIMVSDFLQSLYRIVKATINLCCDIFFNQFTVASVT